MQNINSLVQLISKTFSNMKPFTEVIPSSLVTPPQSFHGIDYVITPLARFTLVLVLSGDWTVMHVLRVIFRYSLLESSKKFDENVNLSYFV